MTAFIVSIAWLVALMFLGAIVAHVRDPQRVRQVVREIGLPQAFAEAAVAIQGAIVALLVLAPAAGFFAAAAFLGAASGIFVVSGMLGRTHSDCGCLSRPHEVDEAFFARNALLGAVTLAGWYWGPEGYWEAGLVAAVIAAAVSVVVLAIGTAEIDAERAVFTRSDS